MRTEKKITFLDITHSYSKTSFAPKLVGRLKTNAEKLEGPCQFCFLMFCMLETVNFIGTIGLYELKISTYSLLSGYMKTSEYLRSR